MIEEILVSARSNAGIDPVLSIWGPPIAIYLFLGGLTAGIMFFSGLMVLLGKEEAAPFTVRRLPLVGLVALSLGMLMLFVDLEQKMMVWRFYTTFQPTSPMSWGSWVLLLVYPALAVLVLARLKEGYPALGALVDRYAVGRFAVGLSQLAHRVAATASVGLAVALGIYTGILLSAFDARPFWHSGLLGPVFLVSGLSTGTALAVIGGRAKGECHLFTRIDIGLIVLELALVALLLVNFLTGDALQREAVGHLLGGEYTVIFWVGFVAVGMVVPLVLEALSLVRREAWLTVVPPLLILGGGYLLRDIVVDVGQLTTWVQYQDQFDTSLLDSVRQN